MGGSMRTHKAFSARGLIGLFINCLVVYSNAQAIPVLTTDNRTITSSGFGQVQGYYRSWNQIAGPVTPYSSFDAQLNPGVDFGLLPPPHTDNPAFILDTYVGQNSSVTPTAFTGSGVAALDTGDNNSTVGAVGVMHVQSLFDIGFALSESYMAIFECDSFISSSDIWI